MSCVAYFILFLLINLPIVYQISKCSVPSTVKSVKEFHHGNKSESSDTKNRKTQLSLEIISKPLLTTFAIPLSTKHFMTSNDRVLQKNREAVPKKNEHKLKLTPKHYDYEAQAVINVKPIEDLNQIQLRTLHAKINKETKLETFGIAKSDSNVKLQNKEHFLSKNTEFDIRAETSKVITDINSSYMKSEQLLMPLSPNRSHNYYTIESLGITNASRSESFNNSSSSGQISPKAILINSHISNYYCLTSEGYYRFEESCDEFVECKQYVASLYKCPLDLQFDQNADFDENPCAPYSVTRCKRNVQPSRVISFSALLISNNLTNFICPMSNGYYGFKGDCEKFVKCENNVPSLNVCNLGLHFDPKVPWQETPCSNSSVARCESSNSVTTPSVSDETEVTTKRCPRWRGHFPLDITECGKYMRCEFGSAIIMSCPAGLVFNAELETCDWPVNVPTCNPEVLRGFSCPTTGVNHGSLGVIINFRYKQSCKNYIACQEGHPRLLKCDRGLSFSPKAQSCVHSDFVTDCNYGEN